LLQPIGADRPEALVRLKWVGRNDMGNEFDDYFTPRKDAAGQEVRATVSYPIFEALHGASASTLVDLTAGAPHAQDNLVIDGHGELVSTYLAAGNFFTVLGVRPATGRLLQPSDDTPAAPAVAVISARFWKRRFGASAAAIGTVARLHDVPVTIVGVTEPSFGGIQQSIDEPPDVTVALALAARFVEPDYKQRSTHWWLQVVGRLRPGSTAAQVEASLAGVFEATARGAWTSVARSPATVGNAAAQNRDRTAVPRLRVESARRGIYEPAERDVESVTLLGIVAFVLLLIVCANVANLLLARAAARQKEISVRLSLGAARSRLVRQLLTESVLLATIGGTAGAVVAWWGRSVLPLRGVDAPADWRLLAFALIVTLGIGVLFGIVPALRATAFDAGMALKKHSRSVAGGRSSASRVLLVVQVALSLVLLVGAGLFLATLVNLRSVDVGFDTGDLILFRVSPSLLNYDKPRSIALYETIRQRAAALPGVRSVAYSQQQLLSGGISTTDLFVDGHTYTTVAPRPRGDNFHQMWVSPGFFDTLGIRVVRGRGFTPNDDEPAPKVVVVNQAALRAYFSAAEQPLGKRLGPLHNPQFEIVGIVSDVRYNSVRDPAPPTVYFPIAQRGGTSASFEVRTEVAPAALANAVRNIVHAAEPNLPDLSITTQADMLDRRLAQERLLSEACTAFAALAVTIASIGLFGLLSYSVARRTNEIGIRMALGAQRAAVVSLVMRESIAMVAAGVAIGLAVVAAAGRLIASLLYGLSPTDPATIAAAITVLLAVSAFAGYLPARRAASVDPMTALRCD
jgi:predicted permease